MERSILLSTILEIAQQLVDSSSSSTENEMEILQPKRVAQPKKKSFVEDVVNAYTETEFKKQFRISRVLYKELVQKYAASTWYIKRSYKGGRMQRPAETHVLAFLWFAANKTGFREVANLYDMSLSNFHNTFNAVLNFLVKDVAPAAIRFPKEHNEQVVNANEFANLAGFPNVLGCIGACHITSRKPKHKTGAKDNQRHDCVYITLQGVCDAKLRFLHVYTGMSSKMHDDSVYGLSDVGKELSCVCAPNQYHLLGDATYPLSEYLLTPYRDVGTLTAAEMLYNTKFQQTRVQIVHAFAALKSRFRQLNRLDFHNVQAIVKFVLACCVLHNLCIDSGEEDLLDQSLTCAEVANIAMEVDDSGEQSLSEMGQFKRIAVKEQLYAESKDN
ncbi:putative nuclease HARBI1 [Zeugodacus cucurbitae]|uniref:Putative nuclease HARBI1 n=1 Tax=Zeugodacus cucurbitae TaxID=28588 RepID=A0A0A1WH73_ZEUCU|nr:putative nuclease HARBI1 [Zeugodacus cucurbitae]